MYVKQPAQGRRSDAAGSLTLLTGKKYILLRRVVSGATEVLENSCFF